MKKNPPSQGVPSPLVFFRYTMFSTLFYYSATEFVRALLQQVSSAWNVLGVLSSLPNALLL